MADVFWRWGASRKRWWHEPVADICNTVHRGTAVLLPIMEGTSPRVSERAKSASKRKNCSPNSHIKSISVPSISSVGQIHLHLLGLSGEIFSNIGDVGFEKQHFSEDTLHFRFATFGFDCFGSYFAPEPPFLGTHD